MLLALALVIWAVVMGSLGFRLGLMGDDWSFITTRLNGGVDDFLAPYAEHILVLYSLLYKSLVKLFGFSYAPMYLVSLTAYASVVVALFIYIRRLVGDGLALIGAIVMLFLGASYDVLLWSFPMAFSISIFFGVAGLILLRREDRIGDLLACAALSASVLTVTLGTAFIAAAAVAVLISDRSLRRSYIALVPLALFAAWYFTWGVDGRSFMSVENLLGAPLYILDAFGYSLTVLTGLFRIDGDGTWVSRLLAVAVLTVIGIRAWHRKEVPKALLIGLAGGIAFWGLAGLNQVGPLRTPDQPRYQLPAAVFTMLIVCGGFAGVKATVKAHVALAIVATAAIWANSLVLAEGYRDALKPKYQSSLASIIALDLLGPEKVTPGARVRVDHLGLDFMDAHAYFQARDRYGQDPRSLSDAEDQPEAIRSQIDYTLATTQPLVIGKAPAKPSGNCTILRTARGEEPRSVPLDRALYIRSTGRGVIKAGRFSDSEELGMIELAPEWIRIAPPDDGVEVPWRITAESSAPVWICRGR